MMMDMNRLTATEIAIASHAVKLLEDWNWAKNGEPLGVLGLACKSLYGEERNTEISNVRKAESEFAPRGSICNNVDSRLSSLRAVVRFHA